MSILDSLFGSNKTQVTEQSSLAPNAAYLANNMFNLASWVGQQPYTPYPNARQADFSPDQRRAFDETRNIATRAGGLYDTLASTVANSPIGQNVNTAQGLAQGVGALGALAPGYLAGAPQAVNNSGALGALGAPLAATAASQTLGLAERFPDANINAYMNPYLDQVLAPALEDLARRDAQERNALNARSARTGSFGGSRNAIAESELGANTMREMGRLSANTRSQAFDAGAREWRLDQQQLPALFNAALGQLASGQNLQRGALATAGDALTNVGAAQQTGLAGQQALSNVANLQGQRYNEIDRLTQGNQGLLATQVSPLLATGGMQQEFNQTNLNQAYQDFLNQRDWYLRGLDVYKGALGVPGATQASTTRQTEGAAPNRLGQVIGAGTGLIGALGLGSTLKDVGGGLASTIGGWFS